MNDIATVIVGIVIAIIAFKLVKGFLKFFVIAALVAGVAYYLLAQ